MFNKIILPLSLILVLTGCSLGNIKAEWEKGLTTSFEKSILELENGTIKTFYSYDDSSKIGSIYKDGYTFSYFNADFDGLPKCNFKYLPVTNYKDTTPAILYYVTQNNNVDELKAFIDIVIKEVGNENILMNDSGYYIFNNLNELTYVLGFNIKDDKIVSYWRVEWDKSKDELSNLINANKDIYTYGLPNFKTSYFYNEKDLAIELENKLGLDYNWIINNWDYLNKFSLEGLTEYDENGLQKSAILTEDGKVYMMDNLSTPGLSAYNVYNVDGGEAVDEKGDKIICE